MATLIKKHKTLPFLNRGTADEPDWVQIKKATEFTHSLNPETEERDYIADEQPTTELMQYKPSMSLSVTTFEGEADFELFYSLYKKKAVGEDAKMQYLIVYVFDSATAGGTTYYYAYRTEATVTVDEFNSVDSTITASIYENGTPTAGYVTLSDGVPRFAEGSMPADEGVSGVATLSAATLLEVAAAYGTYSASDRIKAAIQENYLSKLKSDYGLEDDGELESLELLIEKGQKITATLKFACGAGSAHWPTVATISLPGVYTYLAQAGEGKFCTVDWDFAALSHTAAYTGEHNAGDGTGHEEGETEHSAGESAAIRSADAKAAKALAREIAEKYLAAPWTFDGSSLTDGSGAEVAAAA